MEHIKIYLTDLPPRAHGLTIYQFDEDGQVYYTIIINSRLSDGMQCSAYDHEMAHINNHDFDSMFTVDYLENLRHAG